MSGWAGLRALIFDLDGTLYDSPGLLQEGPRLAVALISERLGLSLEAAEQRFCEERERIEGKRGSRPSSTEVMLSLTGVSLEEWAAYMSARVDPARFIRPEDYGWLRDLLAALHRRYRLGIVSNNNRVLAERILNVLGILDCFDAILTISESRRVKPDPTLYTDMAAMLGVPPEQCLSIGDRLAIDITPAEQAGMRGALVRGPEDLRALGATLLAAAGECNECPSRSVS